MLAMAAGAAVGAGATFLLDPAHGDARRRELAGRIATRGREQLADATRDLGRRAGEQARVLALQARSGFAAATDDLAG